MPTTEPRLEERAPQLYVAIRREVAMEEIGTTLPPLIGTLLTWLEGIHVAPSGAPFFRYVRFATSGEVEVEVGVPVDRGVEFAEGISPGLLPAGRYAVTVHTGPYEELHEATAALLQWAEEEGVVWQTSEGGMHWRARLERYLVNPAEEEDPEKWQTEIAILTA